jgi:hypothetical protein
VIYFIGSLVILVIVSTLILTFVINSKYSVFETECILLEEISSKKLSLNYLSEASLVKIISQTNTTKLF